MLARKLFQKKFDQKHTVGVVKRRTLAAQRLWSTVNQFGKAAGADPKAFHPESRLGRTGPFKRTDFKSKS
ncbi:hypothetical protein [Methanosarcina sp.]|uniref:hypothetical protein n=1 Tax=Methanosarcina sp. TaxID=2213 RepID=UPI003C772B0A